jgi:hypothetical protein
MKKLRNITQMLQECKQYGSTFVEIEAMKNNRKIGREFFQCGIANSLST